MNNAGTPTSLVATDIDGQSRCPNGGCPGASGNPDIGADEFIPNSLDATVTAVNAPAIICPGSNYAVLVTLKNVGSTTMTALKVNWSINGVTQTQFSWSGSLAQGASIASVNIGSYTFGGGIFLKSRFGLHCQMVQQI